MISMDNEILMYLSVWPDHLFTFVGHEMPMNDHSLLICLPLCRPHTYFIPPPQNIWSHCIEKQYIWKEKFKAEKMRSKAKAIVTDIWQPIWYNINININILTLSSYMQVHPTTASNLPTTQMGPRDNF